ncbi:hypothetical protein BDV11DRAFT_177307 [Aspergillus similis]
MTLVLKIDELFKLQVQLRSLRPANSSDPGPCGRSKYQYCARHRRPPSHRCNDHKISIQEVLIFHS